MRKTLEGKKREGDMTQFLSKPCKLQLHKGSDIGKPNGEKNTTLPTVSTIFENITKINK